MPAEAQAYALARYSRSADSFEQSLDWVKSHDSGKFLESFYFAYGHGSIADLGNVTLSFEDISEAAAIEIEDEQAWSGQARSTRYQDFSKAEPVIPEYFTSFQQQAFLRLFERLIQAYSTVNNAVRDHLLKILPKPAEMKQDAYDRTISARAFDSARYLLPLSIPTSVGQVTSIRTLEKQIQRWLVSYNSEVRRIAQTTVYKLKQTPDVKYYDGPEQAVAPTLAKYAKGDDSIARMGRAARVASYDFNTQGFLKYYDTAHQNGVQLYQTSPTVQIIANLLYPVTHYSYRQLADTVTNLSSAYSAQQVIGKVLAERGPHTELPRAFRNQEYIFEIVSDIGAYRDMHRHRRCQQFLQPFSTRHGWETPQYVSEAGVGQLYSDTMLEAQRVFESLSPIPGAEYALPFGFRCRYVMAMDFAEVEYICKLRSAVRGHISYRRIAWDMYETFKAQNPVLGQFLSATDPKIEDQLTR